MGKKGSKRKTRWRTLSIGAPPDEEDEKETLRNGYVKGRENDPSAHTFKRNGQGTGYKPRKGSNGGSSSGYNGGGTRPHRDDSAGSSSQPKIVFNEDEYTRVTTPRQDILFKKSYLLQKKPWAENASTSATPSTTESQSASHSTADGSETTEDQQLLDCGTSENPLVVGSSAQVSYGTFYDHATGYYYEYPVMLFGPTIVPTPMGPDVTAAVACGPVPLRPIEWINPAFVPKLAGQPSYCMNYQCTQSLNPAIRDSLSNHDTKGAIITEEEGALVPLENTNGTCNESGTGSASCSGSVAGEGDEQPNEMVCIPSEDQIDVDYQLEEQVEEQCLMDGMNDRAYMKPMLMQQPVHVSHVLPAVPQPYMYPGHYMFGPPLVNVNGVTIQCGPMIRTTDVAVMSTGCGRRRKKKKRNNQTLVTGNTEDDEEGENSSECDTGLASSRLSGAACPASTTTTTSARTLKPDCKEFQSRLIGDSNISFSADTPISEEESVTNQMGALSCSAIDKNNDPCNGVTDDSKNSEDELAGESSNEIVRLPSKIQLNPLETADKNSEETNRLTNHLAGNGDAQSANDSATEVASSLSNNISYTANDSSSANDSHERSREEVNGVMEEISLVNGKLDSDSNNEDTTVTSKTSSLHNDERTRSRSGTPKTVSAEKSEKEENHESLTNAKSSLPKRKYSTKGIKFVREPTPGPDLNNTVELDLEKVNDATQSLNNVNPNNFIRKDSIFERDKTDDNEVSSNCMSESVCNHLSNEDPIEASNDDSGFESQTKHSEYPITEAVTQWLRKVNSPEMFITSSISDSETENEDEVEEPPKNLEGNPIPALSVNSGADNLGLSCTVSSSEFARINNVKGLEQPDVISSGSRKKKDNKKRSGERRRARHTGGKVDEAMSSSDSRGQQNNSINKKKDLAKDVGNVCEFTEADSVADMRVASNSRIDSKRVNARRTKRQGIGRSNEDLVNNNEKIKHLEDENDNNQKGFLEDMVNVKTFEKGEIVVSEDGKLLTTSVYETLWNNNASMDIKTVKSEPTKETVRNREKRSSSVEEENASGILSLDSIEELDVLECWEAETIEPVITPKKVLQCRGISCEGEAGEEDNIDLKQVNMDYVQKYYRLARESATSIEEDLNSKINIDSVPNRSEESGAEVIKEKRNDTSNIPIDEAFEVYESCYTGKAPFLTIDSKIFKSRTLYGQEGEGPIPCRAVCCNIQ